MVTTHFPPHHLGGDAVFVEYLSRELTNRGHEVHVLHNPAVYGLVRGTGHARDIDAPNDPIRRHQYWPIARGAGALSTLVTGLDGRAVSAARDLVGSVHPDVVHWHNTRGFISRPLVFKDEISLYTSHDYGAICPRSNLLRPNLNVCDKARRCAICCLKWGKPPQLWRARSRRVIELTGTRVISPSQFVANRLAKDGVIADHVINNFVPDPGSFEGGNSCSSDSIVYLGMLEVHKGLRTLIEAFSMSADRQGFVLDIIGTGSLKEELLRTIATTNMKSRIRLHGFLRREQAEQLRSRAVAQIVPSEWYENCPLTILEAFASGVPVVGSDAGGIPEIVGPESGSKLFRCGSAENLADVLTELWVEREDLASKRRKARTVYESRFMPDTHISQYFDVINSSD